MELKFQLDTDRAAEIFEWAQARMDPDPHAQDHNNPIYTVESIYFDTPRLDCLRGNGVNSLPKYRARRYDGNLESFFLEEKLRRQQQVWKRRLPCQQDELASIVAGAASLEGDREWFRLRFRVLRLQPYLVVVYRRLALVGASDERLTIDRCIDAYRAGNSGAGFAEDKGEPQRILELDVLELKHPLTRSPLMRELEAMAGKADQCSKYGRGMQAFGYARNSDTGTSAGSTAREA